MPVDQVAGFLLDSCVLLPHGLETTHQACSNFLKERQDYFITYSIRKEALDLSLKSYLIICDTLRSNLKPALEKNGVKEITNRDGKSIASLFSKQKKRIINESPTRSSVPTELVGVIENYLSDQVHSLKDGVTIPVDALLANAFAELEKARYNMEKPFKSIQTVFEEPHGKLVSFSPLQILVSSPKDLPHIASAIQYQFQENKWVIFVTNDEKHIIFNEEEIWKTFALQCCKPSWAVDYMRELTKLKPPREFYKEILIPSKIQRDFAGIIKNIVGADIIRRPFSTN